VSRGAIVSGFRYAITRRDVINFEGEQGTVWRTGRAMALVVIRRLPAATVRVIDQNRSCGIYIHIYLTAIGIYPGGSGTIRIQQTTNRIQQI
jgi:hypothetical protein